MAGAHFASKVIASRQGSAIPEIKSGLAGYCLDDRDNSPAANAIVYTRHCNGRASQEWQPTGSSTIQHDGTYCLSVQNNATTAGSKIVANPCNGSPGQSWVSAIDGYENPGSALCLGLPNSATSQQVVLASCDGLTTPDEAWQPATWHKNDTTGASLACSGTQGQLVACYAAKEWVAWRSGTISHSSLLNAYTDGNSSEEWCADFVSYIYKEAGYPFQWADRDGWDEYVADNVQNMGFTYHPADGYTPQPGDVAYFDYSGGHVEIVAVGGPKPIFIYGDSGHIDPATGNGDMTENTITNDPSEGQLIYYLSPN